MLCTACHSAAAAYHYKTITNGVVREEHLCHDCAVKLKQGAGQGGFTDLLSGFFMPNSAPKRKVCPVCGTTESEVSRTGQVGCPECYGTFASLLDPYIRRIHGSDTHKGAAPGGKIEVKESEIDRLKDELSKAVQAQEYERAAVLRDKIKEIGGEGA